MAKTIVKFGWSDAYAIDNDKVHLFLKAFEHAIRVNDTYIKGMDGTVWYECDKQTLPSLEMLTTSLYCERQINAMKDEAEQNGA